MFICTAEKYLHTAVRFFCSKIMHITCSQNNAMLCCLLKENNCEKQYLMSTEGYTKCCVDAGWRSLQVVVFKATGRKRETCMFAKWVVEKASVTKTRGIWTPFPCAAKSIKSFTGFVFPLQMILCTCFLPIGPGSQADSAAAVQVTHIRVCSACTKPLHTKSRN